MTEEKKYYVGSTQMAEFNGGGTAPIRTDSQCEEIFGKEWWEILKQEVNDYGVAILPNEFWDYSWKKD